MVFFEDDLERVLDGMNKMLVTCSNCGARFALEEGANGALEIGVTSKAVLCPECSEIFAVDVRPGKVDLLHSLSEQYASELAAAGKVVDPSLTRFPGWYEDPGGHHERRYWNGTTWTDLVSDQGQPSKEPL